MKKLCILSVLAAASVNLLFFTTATGQSPSPSPTPEPSPPPVINGEPSAAVSAPGIPEGEANRIHSKRHVFPSVTMEGNVMTASLRFPVELAGSTLIVQALDGGAVSQDELTVGEDGTACVQFEPPSAPGLYRVMVNAGGAVTLLQFEVPQS